jgi:hypothetical protein
MRRPSFGWLLAIVVCAAPGCALFGGGPEHVGGGATLGQAASQAKPDTARGTQVSRIKPADREKKKPLDVGWTLPEETSTSTSLDEPGHAPSSEHESFTHSAAGQGLVLGLTGLGGSLGGQRYDGFGMLGIDVGMHPAPRWRVDVVGSAGGINFADKTVAGQSFKNELELALDVNTRWYLTPPNTFMGVYPLAGVRFGTMFWDFAKPITVVEDGEPRTVSDDRVNYMSFYGGAGTSLMQLRHMNVGVQLTGGIKIYSWKTHEGFTNDLFPAAGFGQFAVEAAYRF